jgi:hypothetical protein
MSLKMNDEFDAKKYLAGILDPEERARTILENGWSGDPVLAGAEIAAASALGGVSQQVLFGLQKPLPATKGGLRGMNRVRKYRAHWFDTRKATADEPDERRRDARDDVDDDHGGDRRGDRDASPGAVAPPTTAAPDVAQRRVAHEAWNRRPGDFASAIGRRLYEKRKEIWPHLKDEAMDRPWWYEPRPAVEWQSPFPQPSRRERSSDLTGDEAMRVYDAMSFAMSEHGAVMNTHVVILWETLRVYDHRRATKIMSDYLSQARKWARVGTAGEPRRRRRQRTGEGFAFRYVYVHECGVGRGFHSHILCTVPYTMKKAFEDWTWSILRKLARSRGDGTTVVVRQRTQLQGKSAIVRAWGWYRYITKQLDPQVLHGAIDQPLSPLRQNLQVWSRRGSLPVHCMKLVGSSHDVGEAAQTKAGFVSKLRRGEYASIYNGDEINWYDGRAMRRLIDSLCFGGN